MNPFNVESAYRPGACCFLISVILASIAYVGFQVACVGDYWVITSVSTDFGPWPTTAVCFFTPVKFGFFRLGVNNLRKKLDDKWVAATNADFDVYVDRAEADEMDISFCAYLKPNKELKIPEGSDVEKGMIFTQFSISVEEQDSNRSDRYHVQSALVRMYDINMTRSGDIGFPKRNPVKSKDGFTRDIESMDAGLAKTRRSYPSKNIKESIQALYDMLTLKKSGNKKFLSEVYSASTHYLQLSEPVSDLPRDNFMRKNNQHRYFSEVNFDDPRLATVDTFIALKKEPDDKIIVAEYEFVRPAERCFVLLTGLGGLFTLARSLFRCIFPLKFPRTATAALLSVRTLFSHQDLSTFAEGKLPKTGVMLEWMQQKPSFLANVYNRMPPLLGRVRSLCCSDRPENWTHAEELICFRSSSNVRRYDEQL
eukprot:TRINITY_DN19139_c0_g1_i1.p1 TRINITY_DN19139_c0_g1~~TRINITY_DN19139_c0_g1_i1.p1  ORF type:complete len:438 (+),score=32.60 TRINITY_DN19139_c0_g1_i1:44-1315(+)